MWLHILHYFIYTIYIYIPNSFIGLQFIFLNMYSISYIFIYLSIYVSINYRHYKNQSALKQCITFPGLSVLSPLSLTLFCPPLSTQLSSLPYFFPLTPTGRGRDFFLLKGIIFFLLIVGKAGFLCNIVRSGPRYVKCLQIMYVVVGRYTNTNELNRMCAELVYVRMPTVQYEYEWLVIAAHVGVL